MDKREFLIGSSAVLASISAAPALAAYTPVKGRDYAALDPIQRTEVDDGKIEVLEFFWYSCPHCDKLEPVINSWIKKQPKDVVLRRIHVAFRGDAQQKLFLTLQAMGLNHEYDQKVFDAVHRERKRLSRWGQIVDWAEANGIDRKEFESASTSFGVNSELKKAKQAQKAYAVDGVPMLVVNGKYRTSPSQAGSNGAALKVVEALVEMERKG